MLAERTADWPVRVWSAGCASGEEAYSLAIVLAELLGVDEFRRRVKIYATDVDDEALALARHATYAQQAVRVMPADIVERYFEEAGGAYVFRNDLRRSVIFGRNDLVQDAPISRIDILACRNTLMYLNAETQARILSRFHFALSPSGVLFLGKARKCCSAIQECFAPADLKRRVFRTLPRCRARRRRGAVRATGGADGERTAGNRQSAQRGVRRESVAQIVGHVRRAGGARESSGRIAFRCVVARCRPPLPRSGRLLPSARTPSTHRPGSARAASHDAPRRDTPGQGRADISERPNQSARPLRREPARRGVELSRRDGESPASARSGDRESGLGSGGTRNCSRPTKSWRRRTRNFSRPSRSSRPPTRSSSRPTKNSKP